MAVTVTVNTKLEYPTKEFQSADGNIIAREKFSLRSFSNEGLLKDVKPPLLCADEVWPPEGICTGPHGELVTWPRRLLQSLHEMLTA